MGGGLSLSLSHAHTVIQNFNTIRLASKIRVDIKLLLRSLEKSYIRVGYVMLG